MIEKLVDYYEKPGGTVVEVGSRDGDDAKRIGELFNADRVVAVEANPYCARRIERSHPEIDLFDIAITNRNGPVDFWAVDHHYGDILLGQSSTLYKQSYQGIAKHLRVIGMTMDDFVDLADIRSIEVLKIDVEGATYQVLEGFRRMRITRLVHLESEHVSFWEGQRLYEDTRDLMLSYGYEEVFRVPVWTDQSDSIWLRKD